MFYSDTRTPASIAVNSLINTALHTVSIRLNFHDMPFVATHLYAFCQFTVLLSHLQLSDGMESSFDRLEATQATLFQACRQVANRDRP
jgi:hypothetical protein